VENFTWLIANAVGLGLKRWTGFRKLIPWVVVGTTFITNVVKSYLSGDVDPVPAGDGAVGMIAFLSWNNLGGFVVNTAKDSAYALGMHTFNKNGIMQGLLPLLFKKKTTRKR
jgi:hypothetical protein